MIIDSHCHLNRLNIDHNNSLDKIINISKAAGIDNIISVCVSIDELPELEEYSNKYEMVYHTVGMHPSEDGLRSVNTNNIIRLAQHEKCIAIGETGLDYFYNDNKTFSEQKRAFRAHIQAAISTRKPIIVHTRSAKKDTISILKEESSSNLTGVIHCFTEDWEMAKECLDLGFYISFSGIVTFKNAINLKEVAKKVPIDRILVETDSPYLTPVPYRGKSNYPYYVKYVAEYIAKLRDISFEELASHTVSNTKRLFTGLS